MPEDDAGHIPAEWRQQLAGGGISMIVHAVLLLVLGLWVFRSSRPLELLELAVVPRDTDQPAEVETKPSRLIPEDSPLDVEQVSRFVPIETTRDNDASGPLSSMPNDQALAAANVVVDFANIKVPAGGIEPILGPPGNGLDGVLEGRAERYRRMTGRDKNYRSAMKMALAWLAAHQQPDGGWNFDHQVAACNGECGNHGSLATARSGATAIALLPFLATGQTHEKGKYKDVVRRGVYFLCRRGQRTAQGVSYIEPGGQMYSHGLASMTLAELYGMTRDEALRVEAEQAIRFILYAQDPDGGGWRYQPRQRGDTSLLGWQVMAIKSGGLAYISVPPGSLAGASRFLDHVQSKSGAAYGYTDPGAAPATSAIGLLMRMYLGWKREHPALVTGADRLAALGPSPGDMYYNYYATQVLFHLEGERWKKWEAAIKKRLLSTQANEGHAAGSWHFAGGDHGAASGGRLYATAMSTLTLAVPFRYLPLFKQQSLDGFPSE